MNDFPDAHLVARIVVECLHIMQDYPTQTKLTACYNLTQQIFRLFTILGDKDWVSELNDQFHEGIKKELNEIYEDKQ